MLFHAGAATSRWENSDILKHMIELFSLCSAIILLICDKYSFVSKANFH